MREVWEDLQRWRQAGIPAALATVVKINGSGLRSQGAKMAISADGQIAGSVTGGCVEGAVFEEAQVVIKNGAPRLLTFGGLQVAEWDVGLLCGGSIQVYVEALQTAEAQGIYPALAASMADEQPAVAATVVAGPGTGRKMAWLANGQCHGDLGWPQLNREMSETFPAGGPALEPQLIHTTTVEGDISVFVETLLPRLRLVIVGAVHLAIPLVALAKTMNFRTVVVDARAAFATPERFRAVDELIIEWPGDALSKIGLGTSDSVVCLSHDPKLDNPALMAALNSPARYIGALGSRQAHVHRVEALREEGVNEANLRRIHAPVGLDLRARQPEEIALAIMAEIVRERNH